MYFKNMDNECRTPIKIPAIKAIKKPTGSASKTTSGKINVLLKNGNHASRIGSMYCN